MDKSKVLVEPSKLFVYSAVDSRDEFDEVSSYFFWYVGTRT